MSIRFSFLACAVILVWISACSHGEKGVERGLQQMSDRQHHRHDHPEGGVKRGLASSIGTIRPFFVRARCSVRCEGDQKDRSLFSNRNLFHPDGHLYSGVRVNGDAPAGLTSRLSLFADDLCEEVAVKACGSPVQIEKITPVRMESGQWSASLPLGCSRTAPCALSPFDPSVSEKLDIPAGHGAELSFSPLLPEYGDASRFGRGKSPVDGKPIAVSRACKVRLRAHACFGDCMSNDSSCSKKGEYVYTLSSPSFAGEEDYEVCGDALVARLKLERTPKALRPAACREYFFDQVFSAGGGSFSCSAIRFIQPDCDSF